MPSDSTIACRVATPRTAQYDPFAAIYNRWMAEDFCRRVLPVINDILLTKLQANAHILDLCCGSGQMARALTNSGFRVTGVDASDEMVSFARENAPTAKFLLGDARHFRAGARFDAAISTFNSLAHFATVAELMQVFINVRRALQPGAPFLFDLSMEEAYTTKWHGAFALFADDHVCIVRPAYEPNRRLGTNHITVFTREARNAKCGTNLYRRSDFTITQNCHSESDLRSALQQVGFGRIRTFDAERDLGMPGENGRTFFLCS